MSINDLSIHHDPVRQRFETTIDGITAYLSYVQMTADVWNYNHTLVPPALGGRGLGTLLVRHALDYAAAHDKKVIPSCSFVAKYIERRPEYQSLMAD